MCRTWGKVAAPYTARAHEYTVRIFGSKMTRSGLRKHMTRRRVPVDHDNPAAGLGNATQFVCRGVVCTQVREDVYEQRPVRGRVRQSYATLTLDVAPERPQMMRAMKRRATCNHRQRITKDVDRMHQAVRPHGISRMERKMSGASRTHVNHNRTTRNVEAGNNCPGVQKCVACAHSYQKILDTSPTIKLSQRFVTTMNPMRIIAVPSSL